MDVKYLKRVLLTVITAVVSVAFAVYLIYHVTLSFRNRMTTAAAVSISERDSFSSVGYIFRDETVFTSNGGAVDRLYPDGTKVAVGSKLIDVYSSDRDLLLSERIEDIDRKIEILKSSSVSGTHTDVAQLSGNIAAGVAGVRTAITDGRVAEAISSRDALLVQMNKLQLLTGAADSFDGAISRLEVERDSLKGQLGTVYDTVRAPVSGYFYSVVDGGERLFTTAALENMTVSSFDEIISEASSVYPPSGAVGKLATDYRWYLVVKTDMYESEKYSVGKYYDVTFGDTAGMSLSLELIRITDGTVTEESLMVFRSTDHPAGFDFKRSQRVVIEKGEYTGYRVPRSALRLGENGEVGVYVLSGTLVKFRLLNVIYETDSYLISADPDPEWERAGDYLEMNENVIIEGKGLYDGKIVGS
ncbi:MAG: hypothetical protein IKV54_02250 [Clostridia bacterium]|nr:hypothetical protein [Clostridia bacterium]